MRSIIIDTSVLIAAAFRPRSESGALVDAVRHGRFRLIWDAPTRAETEALFDRIPPLDPASLDTLFKAENRFVGATDPSAFGHVPDPDDRKFAALAVAAGAVLISLDAHLLDASAREGLQVMRPGAFLDWAQGPETDEPAS